MTTPDDPDGATRPEGIDLTKGDSGAGEAPFDPYRFGKPEHPIPAEYAPPGYTGPVIQNPPPTPQWGGPPPPGANPQNPFSNPPDTPYASHGTEPGSYPPYGPPPGQYPPPYGPPPGYHPPPPPYAYAPQRTGTNGKAITALVLGIGSIVFCFFSVLDAVLIVPALIFGLIALGETKQGGHGRGLAVAGLWCTAAGTVLAAIFTVLFVHAANQCGGFNETQTEQWSQCVQDHIF